MSTVFEPYGHRGEERRRECSSSDTNSVSTTDTPSEEMADFARPNVVTQEDGELNGSRSRSEAAVAGLEAEGEGFYSSNVGNDTLKKRLTSHVKCTEGEDSSLHDVPFDVLMELTRTLQEQEDRREQEEKIAAAARVAEEHRIRNQRWAEVKARMTARSSTTSAVSLHSAEWDDPEDDYTGNGDGCYSSSGASRLSVRRRSQNVATVPMADDPLIDPESGDERPMRKLMKWEKLPWTVQFWHTAYNWFRWGILGMFYFRELAEDPSGYYQKRRFA